MSDGANTPTIFDMLSIDDFSYIDREMFSQLIEMRSVCLTFN